MTTQTITKTQLAALRKLGLPEVRENNQWLALYMKGDGIRAPESWNAEVYTNSAGSMKVVTTDMAILTALLDGRQQAPQTGPAKTRVISIDDSGWGFPLLGTLVGVHDSLDNSIHIAEVPVVHYQSPGFEAKTYLQSAANKAASLISKLDLPARGLAPSEVLFKVCPGYVNTGIVRWLRSIGCRVETCAIGEPLQSALEKAHAEYVRKHVGSTLLYYDPKELTDANIRKAYSETIKWIQKYNAWHLAKTSWKSLKKLHPGV